MILHSANKSVQRGEALMSLLISMSLFAILMVGITKFIFNSTRNAYDLETRSDNLDNTRKAFDLIVREVKLTGTSLPLGQANFLPSDATLSSTGLAVLTSSTATTLTFRINEKGRVAYLTANYTPSATSLSFTVNDVSDLFQNEVVYISNMPTGAEDGFYGVVSAISGNTVTVSSGYHASASATFKAGSIVMRSTQITYQNNAGNIERVDPAGTVIVAPRASISFSYLDASGTAISLPLTASVIESSLSAISVSVTSSASKAQRNGTVHTSSLTRTIGLRSLIIAR